MKRTLFTLLALLVLFLFWLFRPGEAPPVVSGPERLPELGVGVEGVQQLVFEHEQKAGPLKPDNHARIIWNEEYRNAKAPCSIVYIHGYTASYGEGSPFHARTARELGCHLYIARLHAHGLKTDEPLANMHADSLLSSAAHALSIGNLLGEQVVLVGTSMGGLLSIYLASEFPEEIDALILLAPLIDFATPLSGVFNKAWGQRILRMRLGGSYLQGPMDDDDHSRYWYAGSHIRSLNVLKTLRDAVITEERLRRIKQPVFIGYYYADEDNQDEIVSVSAMLTLSKLLGTPLAQQRFVAFPEADAHVIGSSYRTRVHHAVSDSVVAFVQVHGV